MPTRVQAEGKHQKLLKRIRKENLNHFGFGVLPAKEIKVCNQCGSVCKAEESNCFGCGARLADLNLYQQSIQNAEKCPFCRSVLSERENYCPSCGKKLINYH